MDTLNKLWQYNNWANQALIHLFTEQSAILPPECLRLFSHIVNTQSVWLSRLEGTPQLYGAWDEHTLATCIMMHNEASPLLEEQLLLSAEQLSAIIEYKNSTGKTFHNSRYDILIHVLNHGTYHRAQIATELRRHGIEPINTDYISYVRR